MKRIIKKNQVIITSLVIMIVVAGYLNFTADQSTTAVSGNKTDISSNQAAETGEEDTLVDVAVNPEEDLQDVENAGETMEDAEAGQPSESENIDDVSSIGEAVLTSSAAAEGFSAAARLSREQVRSQNREVLMEIINNSASDEAAVSEAMASLTAMNDAAEKEQAAETLLEAKGFGNSVVSMNDGSVDVVICMESIDDTQRAQIEDIVKRKAGVTADQIVITTLEISFQKDIHLI